MEKKENLSKTVWSRLYQEDDNELNRLVNSTHFTKSQLIRVLINQALKQKLIKEGV